MVIPLELRLDAIDRRGAAGHEAGHYVIARHVGLHDVGAWIGRLGTGNTTSVGWIGQMVFRSDQSPVTNSANDGWRSWRLRRGSVAWSVSPELHRRLGLPVHGQFHVRVRLVIVRCLTR
jgi:hypothetical protein